MKVQLNETLHTLLTRAASHFGGGCTEMVDFPSFRLVANPLALKVVSSKAVQNLGPAPVNLLATVKDLDERKAGSVW
jgi:hypothetical protein